MKRAFETAWGAHVLPGGVRFQLWAPAAQTVAVVLVDEPQHVRQLHALPGGWFEIFDDHARAGSRYMFEIDGHLRVADPASRFQPDGPEAPSMVVDPSAFDWPDRGFVALPYEQSVIYELHVGTFTGEGTYAAAARRLHHIADLGATAIELLPLAQAPGLRDWGYDGVQPYAPAHAYGTPEDLKRFIVAAHDCGLAVLLDVVYNHFGPQGNYLSQYAPQFFSKKIVTPWGDGIDYSSVGNDPVRRFAIDNACYWLTEYCFDGLRLDATPMIADTRTPHVLDELREDARKAAGRRIYLVAEDVKNEIVDRVRSYDGRWSDDPHDAVHVLLTGDASAYYDPFRSAPLERGFGTLADEEQHLVQFLQNHDQIGNRPFGDRITNLASDEAIRAALALLLLAPAVPLLFMGEEWGASTPFLFFCDFEPALARRVTEGRRREFANLAEFADPQAREKIPDPSAHATFEGSKLDWDEVTQPHHAAWLRWYRDLLARRKTYARQLAAAKDMTYQIFNRSSAIALWRVPAGRLQLAANLSATPCEQLETERSGETVFSTHERPFGSFAPAWSVRWSVVE